MRSGDTAEMVSRGLLSEAEASDPNKMEAYAKQLEVAGNDPDYFVVLSVDFMTVGWKPSA